MLWVLVLVLAFAAGCASQSGSSKQFKDLTYSLTGGIAGFDQRIAVKADGSYQLSEKGKADRAGKLSDQERKALQDLAGKVKWAGLQAQYVDPKVADAMMEGVKVTIGEKQYETVVGTGGQAPAELSQLLAQLKQIMTDHR
jgi:hypothetical protein